MRREVDDQQPSTRTQHARRLTDRARTVVEEVQHLMQDDNIERTVGKWQVVDITLPDAAIPQACPLEAVAREQQHVEREINPKAPLDIRPKHFEHAARSGAEIEQ